MTFIEFVEKRLSRRVPSGERRKSIIYLGENRQTGTFILSFTRKGVPSKNHIYEGGV